MAARTRLPDPSEGPPPRPVPFTHDGRDVLGVEGDTVGSALFASSCDVLSRSIKYHRPRGLFCVQGHCEGCMVRVDGVPNVRACVTPLRDGIRVESQNAWPDAQRDVYGVLDAVMPSIDFSTSFTRPAALRPLFVAAVRRFSGLGRPPDPAPAVPPAELPEVDAGCVVVGAGPAGLAAAGAAAEEDARVLLLDEQAAPGGHLAWSRSATTDASGGAGAPAAALRARLVDEAHAAGVDVQGRCRVLAVYPGRTLLVARPDGLAVVRARSLVLATGTYEDAPLFADWDRPGVLLSRGAARLLHEHRIRPGLRAVVLGSTAAGLSLARDLAEAGVEEAQVFEPGTEIRGPAHLAAAAEAGGVRVHLRTSVVSVRGDRGVRAARLGHTVGMRVRERGRWVPCDLVAVALGLRPRPELFQQIGAALAADPEGRHGPVVSASFETTIEGVFAAGDAVRPADEETAIRTGRAAGAAAGRVAAAPRVARATMEATP
ncbi:MAG: 2Fe-2S iron-sulfur cluster-binding protein [Methanobacteriota archaeon]